MNSKIKGDITEIEPEDIPPHDVLCAGFPCQPFSQAGKRKGFKDKGRGNLFYSICKIVEYHRPRYIFLENVANLKGHDNGKTWKTIKSELEKLNYKVAEPQILSPHQFGTPQHRKRIYIVCENREYGELENFDTNLEAANLRKAFDKDIDLIRKEDLDCVYSQRLTKRRKALETMIDIKRLS